MSFYLTLPSNSSLGLYPNNHAGHYLTRLSQTIDLDGGQWEVGLAEIQFSNHYINVEKDTVWLTYTTPNKESQIEDDLSFLSNPEIVSSGRDLRREQETVKVTLSSGLYTSNASFIDELNEEIAHSKYFSEKIKLKKYPLRIEYKAARKKAKVIMTENGSLFAASPALERILGMPEGKKITGEKKMDEL